MLSSGWRGSACSSFSARAALRLRRNGVLEIRIKDGAEFDLANSQALIEAVREVSGGTHRPCLALLAKLKSVTRDSRHCFSGLVEVLAIAMVVGSPISRAIGNFFIGLNRPPVPIRLLESETAAEEWPQLNRAVRSSPLQSAWPL
jgi:hypothetical protein